MKTAYVVFLPKTQKKPLVIPMAELYGRTFLNFSELNKTIDRYGLEYTNRLEIETFVDKLNFNKSDTINKMFLLVYVKDNMSLTDKYKYVLANQHSFFYSPLSEKRHLLREAWNGTKTDWDEFLYDNEEKYQRTKHLK
jgi:hypothetical protein